MDLCFTTTSRLIQASTSNLRLATSVHKSILPGGAATTRNLTLVFAHANGFCKEMWNPVLLQLAHLGFRGKCVTFDIRNQGESGLANRKTFKDMGYRFKWTDNVNDYFSLIKQLELKRPLIGVGHSIGGCTVLKTEIDHPGTFDALISIDPVLFVVSKLPPPGQKIFDDIATMTLKKRTHWASKHEALKSFQEKPYFSSWHPEVLDLFVQHCLHPDSEKGGVSLTCLPQEEANTFTGDDIISDTAKHLKDLTIPSYFICGRNSTFIPSNLAFDNASQSKLSELVLLPHIGHLVPFEATKRTAIEIYRISHTYMDVLPEGFGMQTTEKAKI